MKAFVIQFPDARRRWRDLLFGQLRGASLWVPVAALAAAGIVLAAAAIHTFDTSRRLAAAQGQLQAAQQARERLSLVGRAAQGPSALQSAAWNQIAHQLNMPWPRLLDALELRTPEDIALVSIEPDPRQGSIRLQAEAKSLDMLLSYVDGLKAAGQFDSVVLLKHETNDQDPARPVRLSLDVRLLGQGVAR